MLIDCNPRELHLLMVKDPKKGGYKGAWKDGQVRFSYSTLVHYWPNWLTQMNDSLKMMCGCDTCVTMDDLHRALNCKRRKLMHHTESKICEMEDGAPKLALEMKLKEYKNEVLDNGGTSYKYQKGMDAAEQYGCGVKVDIDGASFPHFSCVLGHCKECDEKDYDAPAFELVGKDDEIIQYTRFTTHVRCNVHGCLGLRGSKCTICDNMLEEDRKALKAKIQKKKLRTRHKEPLKKFVKKRGTYAKQLRKMFSHKYHVILLGKDHKKKSRFEHTKRRANIVKTERDFTERWDSNPNGQAQHEYFNKDESLGMEGISVMFKPKGQDKYETRYYSILSTEKAQDGNIVYQNTRIMFQDLKQHLYDGSEIVQVNEHMANGEVVELQPCIIEILDDSDGCAVQYRCATAFFMIQKLCIELDIVYDRGIDAPGHGKKWIDAAGGVDKTCLDNKLCRDMEYQPEALDDRKDSVLIYHMEDGQRRDLAELAYSVLSNIDRAGGVKKVPSNKPRKQVEKSETSLASRHYFVRKEGDAKWGGIKMKAIGFPAGKGNGMKFHYNFRFEKGLGSKFAFRRIPCSCDGCYEKLQEPIKSRYSGPCDTCKFWKMFEKKDGSGDGLNDWRLGSFQPREDCDMAQLHAAKADTLQQIGKDYAPEVIEGNFVAHHVDHPQYSNYYLAQWTGVPIEAEEDKVIELDAGKYTVYKGDWYCEAVWMDKLRGGRNWWTMTARRCIIRLETVLDPDVLLRPRSEDTPLPSRLNKVSVNTANKTGAWRLSDTDHTFFVEETLSRSSMEFEDDIAQANSEESIVVNTQWGILGGDDEDSEEE